MIAPSERILTRISDAELARRWSAVRKTMRERRIEALVMQATNDWLGGYVKWFTDLPANNGYARIVIFHADDPMTVIQMGPKGAVRALDRDPLHRGVGEMLLTPSFPSINYTHEYDAELAAAALKRRDYRMVGFVGKGALPHALVAHLKGALTGTVFVDATDRIDEIKAIKSPEELALIRRCAEMQVDETLTIQDGMNLAVHQGYERDSIFAVICDNHVVGPNGPGECLHKTPKQIFEVST